jgi:hypothetical protein
VGTSGEGSSKGACFEGARRMALKHIEAFVGTFSHPSLFSLAAASSAPAALSHVTEAVFIHEAGHLRCRSVNVCFNGCCSCL